MAAKTIFLALLLTLIFGSCVRTKNVAKEKTQQQIDTETKSESVIHEKIDTMLVIPARFDSVIASIRDLFEGVHVGPSEVRYDTVARTLYLNTPIKYIPYYVNRDIKTTVYQTKKEKSSTAVKDKDVKTSVPWWLYALLAVGLLSVGFFLSRKFF